jgi:hypothetical protein
MYKVRNFHEGHSTDGEWQGSGRVAAGERHGMYESALRGKNTVVLNVQKDSSE